MSIVSQAGRDFNKALSTALGSLVKIHLEIDYPNHFYLGKLMGFDLGSQSIVLEQAKNEKHVKYPKLFIHGKKWVSFSIEGAPFPMDKLAERLRKILPGEAISVSDDNSITVLNGKLRITEKGVEGRGPTRERVQKVYDMFIADMKH